MNDVRHNYFSEALNDTLPVALSVLAGDIAASGMTLFSEKNRNYNKIGKYTSYFITSMCMCR